MTGKSESKKLTIDEKHERVVKLAAEYPGTLGVKMAMPSDAETFLTYGVQEHRRMTAEECGEASVVLSQMAVYIQLELNRMQADLTWCENAIDFMVANVIHSCGNKYTPFPYKRKIAIKNNDVAVKLQGIVSNIQVQMDALNYLPSHLKAVASSYGDLQQTKRNQRA